MSCLTEIEIKYSKTHIEVFCEKNLDRVQWERRALDCTTCKTCTPDVLVFEAHGFGHWNEGNLIEEGHIPKTIIEAMESAYKLEPGEYRKIKGRVDKGATRRSQGQRLLPRRQAEFLYFVGCTASSDPRIQEIASPLSSDFNKPKSISGSSKRGAMLR